MAMKKCERNGEEDDRTGKHDVNSPEEWNLLAHYKGYVMRKKLWLHKYLPHTHIYSELNPWISCGATVRNQTPHSMVLKVHLCAI